MQELRPKRVPRYRVFLRGKQAKILTELSIVHDRVRKAFDRIRFLSHLSESHLIRQNTVDTLFVQRCQPIQAFELIFFELCHQHFGLSDGQRSVQRGWVLKV